MKYETGYFLNKFPYVKFGKGKQKVICLLQTGDLIFSIKRPSERIIKMYTNIGLDNYETYLLGYDPNWPEDYTFENLIDDCDRIIKEEVGEATLIGVSFGGFLAVPLARKNPDLIKKMVLLGSACRASDEGYVLAKSLIKSAKEESYYNFLKKLVLLFRRRWINFLARLRIKKISKDASKFNPLSTFINAYNALIDYGEKNKELLKDIRVKTLIIGADKDQFFSEEVYRETAELIPNAKLKLFKNETHMFAIERSREVKKVIQEFLS